MKVIKSLKNRGILSKGTPRKITCQERAFFNFLKPLMTAGLQSMKNVLTPLAKHVLIPLGLTASPSGTDVAIQKKIYESGTKALVISTEEMEDIMKIVKFFRESGLLIKGISEIIKNEAVEQKDKFISMLLESLAASILGNALIGNGDGHWRSNKSRSKFLMPPRPLTKSEMQKYSQNEPKIIVFIQEINYPKQKMGHMK